jgi:hypothetical protein
MRVALYARVSTSRQAQAQTIEQQLERLQAHVQAQGETVAEQDVFRDAGYSGASLSRPGLDQLRDRAALAEFDRVVVTAPDRLARKYVHQILLIEELHAHGCSVEFVERPMSQDPHDQLLLQIRGAVALTQLDTSQQRLLDAYLAGVLTLPVFDRKRHELTRRQEALQSQQRQLDTVAQQHIALSAVAESLEAFCAQVRDGLHEATFEQRRALVELLIDRVIVTDGDVEIRYVFPTTCHGPPIWFSQLRVDYLHFVPLPIVVLASDYRTAPFGAPRGGTTPRGDAHLNTTPSESAAKAATIIPTIRDQLPRSLLGTAS